MTRKPPKKPEKVLREAKPFQEGMVFWTPSVGAPHVCLQHEHGTLGCAGCRGIYASGRADGIEFAAKHPIPILCKHGDAPIHNCRAPWPFWVALVLSNIIVGLAAGTLALYKCGIWDGVTHWPL